MIVACTGPRSYEVTDHDTDWVCTQLEVLAPSLVLCGGARGWDHFVAWCAMQCGRNYVLVLPSPDFRGYYWRDNLEEFDRMAKAAYAIEYVRPSHYGANGRAGHANFDRNAVLAAAGDVFLAYRSDTPGTRHCIREIELRGKRDAIQYCPF